MFRASGIFLLWLACSCLGATPPPSPCPDVFSYHYDNSRGWYGVVTILPPASFSMVQLVFKMTVADYTLNRGYGRIEVLGGNAEVQEISKRAYQGVRERIQFVINFPPVNNIPRVKEVIINNVTFCSDRRDYGRGASITLDYSIKTGLNVPAVSGNQFSILPSSQHQIPFSGGQPTQTQFGNVDLYGGTYNTRGNTAAPASSVHPTQTQRPQFEDGGSYGGIFNTVANTPAPGGHQSQPQGPQFEDGGSYGGIFNTVANTPAPEVQSSSTTVRPHRKRPKTTTTTAAPEYDDDDPDEAFAGQDQCGVHDDTPNFLVLEGTEAEKGQWPWHIALYMNDNAGLKYACGGTLVTNSHVVTAAHCVYNRGLNKAYPSERFAIFLGKHDLTNLAERSQQLVSVVQVFMHPDFGKEKKSDFDISVLKFSPSAKFNDFIRPACLWDKPSSLKQILNKAGTVVGWGVDEFGNRAQKRRVAKMPVVSQETCLRSDDFFFSFTSAVTYCAGYKNGTTVCKGDSGGGMLFKLSNPKRGFETWYLRGVVSTSKKNENSAYSCDSMQYAVFTDVAKLMPWLYSVLES